MDISLLASQDGRYRIPVHVDVVALYSRCRNDIQILLSVGMSMLADTYTDDKERSRSMGIALGGIAFGVLSEYNEQLTGGELLGLNEQITAA